MTDALLREANDATIQEAATLLKAGGLVGLPTETVYGLAADATNAKAVAKIFDAKGRPAFNPLIAHMASAGAARSEGVFNPSAQALADAFWPGPLTLVVPVAKGAQVCDLARAGLDSIALRVPAHPVAQRVLKSFGGPVAAPSANPSGRLSPTSATHVANDLGRKVDLILDGGPCDAGLESTIVGCLGDRPTLLREGAVPIERIEAEIGALARPDIDPDTPSAPGQLLRHYAPRAALRLNVHSPRPDEVYLGFGARTGAMNLSPTSDLQEAAANLFAMLRLLDETADRIAVAPIPRKGLGAAINDRLERAAKRD
ncbi:MAG: L-threonylcarbamoyladenylate synthase [Pseudomonadota bacterium]